jgi:CHAT domain-containing protein/uncharacterized protein HemY
MNIRQLFFILGIFFLFPVLSCGQSLQLADSLFQTGKKYDDGGNMEESEFYYREAYDIYRDFQDTASWLKAGKEYASAMMYRAKNEQAMKLYKKLLDVDHPTNDAYNRGDLYNSMGLLSRRTGKLDQAQAYYQKSLPLAEESGDSLLIGVIHSNLGSVHKRRGNYANALEQEQQALSIFRGLDRKRNIAITLGNIGGIYQELSVYDKALEYYNQSLEIREALGDIRLLANTYNEIGSIQRELSNYDQALVSYQKSLELSRRAGTPSQTSNTLNNIGLLYKSLGEYDKALDYYQQSLAIKEKTSAPSSIATTSKNIGKLLWDQEKYKEAAQYYRKALELRRQIGNPRDIASSLNTMVELALEEEIYEEAVSYAHEIQAIGDSTDSYRILQYAARYLGRIYSQQGDHNEAVKHYKKSHAYSEYLTPTKELSSLMDLAREYNKLNSDSSLVYGEKAIDIIEEQRTNAGAISELKSGFFGRYSAFYTKLASWTLKYNSNPSRAYKLVEQAKARSLSEELAKASQNIEEQLPEEMRLTRNEKRDRINSLYTELESTIDDQQRIQIQRKIRDAEMDYAAFENQLYNELPGLKTLESPESITLEHAQRIMDPQTAALEYAVAGNKLIMFLISQNDVHVEQYLLANDQQLVEEITTWVTDFKDAILSNASRAALRSESAKLYEVLIKPFEEELNDFENLIIVPDGALAYLPFEAISQGDQYLIENFNIKYEPSLTSLTLLQNPEPVTRKDLLAVAGSQISEENSRSIRSANLSALPSTVIEVDSIATHFRQVSTLKEDGVSEEAFKNLLRQNRYQYIHMATHGVIDEEHPNRSGLALSAEGEITVSSKEDGMLRTSEIFGLNIDSDMVVLSACNTGLGKVVGGEGILGMQRSFFYAGTSTVVVSLWNVYDRSTASFMNEFYKALLNTESEESWMDSMLRWIGWDESIPFGQKASAMRQAKLQMIKHPLFNHPIYWAPFIVVGR